MLLLYGGAKRNESRLDGSVARVKQVDGPAVVVLIVKLPPLLALIGKFIRGAEETDLILCSLS